jgi:hypothetical protein
MKEVAPDPFEQNQQTDTLDNRFSKILFGDKMLKCWQTLRPHWFYEPHVLAYGKYDTLQVPYISHVHSNQKFWT